MSKKFAGNGLSRTAMVFKIATMAGHKLTIPEMNRIKDVNPRNLERVYNRIKDVNPRNLERVYEEVIRMGGGK